MKLKTAKFLTTMDDSNLVFQNLEGCPTVTGMDGKKVVLADLFREKRVIICFLRHFKCRFCYEMVAALNKMRDIVAKDYEEHLLSLEKKRSEEGSKVNPEEINDRLGPDGFIVIGLGTEAEATEFRNITNFKGSIYLDDPEDRLVYRSFGLKDGKHTLFQNENSSKFREETIKAAKRASDKGFKDGEGITSYKSIYGQTGGLFVVGPGNSCDYVHRSSYAGDHPDMDEAMLAAIGKKLDGTDFEYQSTKKWREKLQSSTMQDSKESNRSQSKSKDKLSKIVTLFTVPLCLLLLWLIDALHPIPFTSKLLICVVLLLVTLIWSEAVPPLRLASLRRFWKSRKKRYTKLYTPQDVDAFSIQSGIACDCSVLDENIFMGNSDEVDTNVHANDINQAFLEGEPKSCPVPPEDLKELQLMLCYLREFCGKPNPMLGRPGSTCPFVPTALRKNSLYMGVVRTEEQTTKEDVMEVVSGLLERFSKLEPVSGKYEIYKSIVVAFPKVSLERVRECIDAAQAEIKEQFVQRGLMIGEFHLLNNTTALKNEGFFPLRTLTPCMAMRRLVPTDTPFLDHASYSKEKRIKYLEGYLENMKPKRLSKTDEKAVLDATAALEKLKKEQ
eukprot:m.97317 g.97317  ORF g.97317 m.97317 type:complete len:614 (+) comp13589_c0_seq2:283-2124(+)